MAILKPSKEELVFDVTKANERAKERKRYFEDPRSNKTGPLNLPVSPPSLEQTNDTGDDHITRLTHPLTPVAQTASADPSLTLRQKMAVLMSEHPELAGVLHGPPAPVEYRRVASHPTICRPRKRVFSDKVINAVRDRYRVSREKLFGPRRTKDVIRPRRIMWYLMREMTPLTFNQIGLKTHRDHSTVVYGYYELKGELQADKALRKEIEELMEEIKAAP
jgi:hypothetical protein